MVRRKNKPRFPFRMRKGNIVPIQKDTMNAWARGSFKDGDLIHGYFSKADKEKTNPQLGYWHVAVCVHAAQGFTDTYETFVNPKQADKILSKIFLTENKDTELEYVVSKADITCDHMSDLISEAIYFCAETLGVVVPSPKSMGYKFKVKKFKRKKSNGQKKKKRTNET